MGFSESVLEHTDSSSSYGWQQDEAGVVPCGAGEKPARHSERARQNGAALPGSPGMPAVHTLWHSASPNPGHAADPKQAPTCHSGHSVPYVSGIHDAHTFNSANCLKCDTHVHHSSLQSRAPGSVGGIQSRIPQVCR